MKEEDEQAVVAVEAGEEAVEDTEGVALGSEGEEEEECEEDVEGLAIPFRDVVITRQSEEVLSPEEEEAPHLPEASPARILRHVDHIELILDLMGLDGLFRHTLSSHWMRCLTTKYGHLAKKGHPDKPGGSAAQMEELKWAYEYLQGVVEQWIAVFAGRRSVVPVR